MVSVGRRLTAYSSSVGAALPSGDADALSMTLIAVCFGLSRSMCGVEGRRAAASATVKPGIDTLQNGAGGTFSSTL
jgi:hypothetical protein